MIPLRDFLGDNENNSWNQEDKKNVQRWISKIMGEISTHTKLTKKKQEETEVIVSVITSFMFQFVWNQSRKAEKKAVSTSNTDAQIKVVELQSELQDMIISIRRDLIDIKSGNRNRKIKKEPLKKMGNLIQFPVKKGGES
jgi:hypothetical protein